MTKLLNKINSLEDFKQIPVNKMDQLATEIREFLIKSVSATGGHLAPNLGVVELTLALHYVYNSPNDKIIWDVGHQSYIHKLLTGRKDRFGTLRQFGGISGFPKISESPHDTFNTGHSSTSISAALGMAKARDLSGDNYQVIAVIGDGALTGGMAFEALNHAGDLGTDIIVVLNDNEMSISSNVGALSSYLSRLRTDPMYEKGKDEIEQLLKRIPAIGSKVLRVVDRLKDSLKYLVVPGMLFEELGFTYLGQIDGHHFGDVKTVLERAKQIKGPKLVHVITKKGRGYHHAESNPNKFHGIGSFDLETGEAIGKKNAPTYTEIFGKTLVELAENDDKIVAITAAMPDGTGLTPFSKKYPDRFFDVGIAEQHAVTMAAGLATQGYKPIVAIYSTFMQRAYDQVLHDVCLQKLPVIFAIDRAGLVGEDGETHHGLFDLSFMGNIPNLVLMSPKDESELKDMLFTATKLNGPVAIRYPRGSGLGVALKESFMELSVGKGELIVEGDQLTIAAVGNMVQTAIAAAKILKDKGIAASVINSR
ncbi:MAG: 1-deoxy-D-xylulose-5-phosphate synthase, partial [Bacillota bacterium]|nr:1-deoxy-D-xylulose-5-phosphate synthase [Bacillota bacterium]